jgi:glutamine synthetase
VAALIAAGLHGIENELPLEPEFTGNAYDSDKPQVPSTLRAAAAQLSESKHARAAFGDEVIEHYLNNARVELAAYDAAVTDWEKFHGFERL